jgi:hypothetical protein
VCEWTNEHGTCTGTESCDGANGWVGCDAAEPLAELCNDLDDNCDGDTDEDFPDLGQPCDGADSDQCENGTWTCAADGSAAECTNESVTDIPEICSGLDDDCDGDTDEDWPELGQACDGPDSDMCANGTWTCLSSGLGTECANESVTDIQETCNYLDDDCDGDTDEDWPDVGQACDGADSDLCANGTWTCHAGGQSLECTNESVTDIQETCNGLDDDCDTDTDEDWPDLGQACDGPDSDQCANGTWTCHADGLNVECANESVSYTELCNAEDDDCDGDTDEDWPELGAACDGSDSDECENGTWTCHAGGQTVECVNESVSYTESCNDQDDDCDGLTDEDFHTGGSSPYDGGPYAPDAGKYLGESCGTGLCAGGEVVCHADGSALTCSTLHHITNEGCNGLDDDCDGTTDDPFIVGGTDPYDGGPYSGDAGKFKGDSCGTGDCVGGTVVCDQQQTALTCSTLDMISPEVCDTYDNDCDGVLNNGLAGSHVHDAVGTDDAIGLPFTDMPSRVNYLYSPDALGFAEPMIFIDAISFRLAQGGATTYDLVDVRLDSRPEVALCTDFMTCMPFDDTAPIIFSGAVDTTGSAGDWITIPLDPPYLHDTTLSLVVDATCFGGATLTEISGASSTGVFTMSFGEPSAGVFGGAQALADIELLYDCGIE